MAMQILQQNKTGTWWTTTTRIKVHLGGRIWMDIFACLNVLVEVKNLFQVRGSLNQCWMVLKCSLDSQFGSRNENQLTPSHVRITLKIDFRFSHEWKPDHENWFIYIYRIYLFIVEVDRFSNRTYIQLSKSLYQLLAPFVVLLTKGCYSSPVAFILFMLLPFFSHCAALFTWWSN